MDEWIQLPSADDPIPPCLEEYAPHVFQGARGALDGTHVYVTVPKSKRDVFISGRKDSPTMNVFAACDFDLNFISVFAGFEGSAHDSRVLSHARTNGNFKMPPNTYLLGDAGYALAKDVLTPHRSVKYHSWEKHAR